MVGFTNSSKHILQLKCSVSIHEWGGRGFSSFVVIGSEEELLVFASLFPLFLFSLSFFEEQPALSSLPWLLSSLFLFLLLFFFSSTTGVGSMLSILFVSRTVKLTKIKDLINRYSVGVSNLPAALPWPIMSHTYYIMWHCGPPQVHFFKPVNFG